MLTKKPKSISPVYSRCSRQKKLASGSDAQRVPWNVGPKRLSTGLFAFPSPQFPTLPKACSSDSIHNSRWVTTIADAMKRCEIEANLDGMVLESQDLNILSKYNILKNFVEGRKFLKVYFKSSPHYCKDHDHTT